MSLFGNSSHYTKPGPGVRKDEPPKPPFLRFFEVLGRKFIDLCKLNLIFAVPVAVITTLVIVINLAGVTNIFANLLPVILLFPFLAGITFVTRNYVREEHAFVLSDFVDAVKENIIKFLTHGIISYLFVALVWICVSFYLKSAQSGNPFFFLPVIMGIMLAIIFAFMQFYIPLMIVTFDINLKEIYKNAAIFAITAFPRNICLLLYVVGLSFASFFMINTIPSAAILLAIAVGIMFSFSSFLINFAIYPVVEKNMIVPYYEKLNKENADGTGPSKDQKFFYENGRLYRNYDYEEKDDTRKK